MIRSSSYPLQHSEFKVRSHMRPCLFKKNKHCFPNPYLDYHFVFLTSTISVVKVNGEQESRGCPVSFLASCQAHSGLDFLLEYCLLVFPTADLTIVFTLPWQCKCHFLIGTLSRPLSFLSPEDFICFVYFGMINSVKCLKCIPQKERLKVK